MRIFAIVTLLLLALVGPVSAQEQELPLLPSRPLTVIAEAPVFPEPMVIEVSVPQTTSERGIAFLKDLEAFRARAYHDAGGGYSIGYGFQTWKGRRVTAVYPGRVTEAQAHIELRRQLELYEGIVRDELEVDVPQSTFDALVSIAYNTGRMHGRPIISKINRGKILVVADFTSTATGVRPTGRVSALLVERRKLEFKLHANLLDMD
jgi:lysozyme